MNLAISTACLYPLETEKSLEELLKVGFRQFEVFANCESEFSDPFLSELKARLQPYEAKVCSVHLFTSGLEPYMFFSDYPRRFRDCVSQYKRYFAKAANLGASFVIFHGDRRDGRLSIEEYCERFSTLSDAASNEGVSLAQENVARCRSATISQVRRMKEILGKKVKFALDVKQVLRAGESPFDMCDVMGENIAVVHLSDNKPGQDCLLPGAGTFDIKKLTERLSSYGFDGSLVIEVYRNGFGEYEELSKSAEFMSRIV
jgi:sugar phosphate isomerase/epimerase